LVQKKNIWGVEAEKKLAGTSNNASESVAAHVTYSAAAGIKRGTKTAKCTKALIACALFLWLSRFYKFHRGQDFVNHESQRKRAHAIRALVHLAVFVPRLIPAAAEYVTCAATDSDALLDVPASFFSASTPQIFFFWTKP
jgi:hypothetical protein